MKNWMRQGAMVCLRGVLNAAPCREAVLLLQYIQRRAEVDVIRLTRQHQRGYRLHASALGFAHAVFTLTQMDDFNIEARRVECGGDVLFCGNTHRTTGVIEYGFGFHVYYV